MTGITTDVPQPQTAQQRWEHRTQWLLLSLAVLFAVAYAVPIVRSDVDPALRRICSVTEWTVWAVFVCDYAIRLYLAEHRWQFLRGNPLALLAVLLPLLQPLRLLRLVSALLLVGQRARLSTQVKLTTYVAGACTGLLLFGSLAVLEVERGQPGATINSLGDAVWWSFTTMTTVGYGDLAPTTGLGRVLAIGLMLSGIALLGVVTANIAAWFIAQFDREDAEEERRTEALAALTAEVRALRTEVRRLTVAAPAAAGADGADTEAAETEAAGTEARGTEAEGHLSAPKS